MDAGSRTASGIALVISDVDGTLVTDDKSLAASTIAAVKRLRAAGIGFSIASARPPVGLRALAAELALDLPMGAFNGASVVRPDLSTIEERLIPVAEAYEAQEAFYTSASAFVMPVVQIDDRTIGEGRPGPITRRMRELYIAAARQD